MTIFVDTSAFLAIENRRDTHHRRALFFKDTCLRAGLTFITSDYVLDETYTILLIRAGHAVAVEFGEALRASWLLQIEHVTPEILDEAWRFFQGFADPELSFTDCTSLALMERLGIGTAFSFHARLSSYGRFRVRPSPLGRAELRSQAGRGGAMLRTQGASASGSATIAATSLGTASSNERRSSPGVRPAKRRVWSARYLDSEYPSRRATSSTVKPGS